MALFETSVTVSCTPEQAFDFIRVTANRVKLSPPSLGLHIVKAPEVLSLGSQVEFKIHSHGIVQNVIHEIIEFERPSHFVEKQIKGPLKQWVHRHSFVPTEDGKVLVTDRIEFAPPGGLAGFLITEAKILESLEDGFHHRQAELLKFLGGGA